MPASKSQRVSPKQVTEWTENPVTIALLEKVSGELQDIMNTPAGECLSYGQPNLTHEKLVRLEASAQAWSELYLVLGGDWSFFEELDNE